MFRRKAKWIFYRDEQGFKQCKCSNCLHSFGSLATPYCPNCGRKMNKSDNSKDI